MKKSELNRIRSAVTWLHSQHASSSSHKQALPGQPFDGLLLAKSALFRKSRTLYQQKKGKFVATLVSSPRTLSSPTLLENEIQYSPVDEELLWAATDPGEKEGIRLQRVRTYVCALFHEQNHRILWNLLPPCPKGHEGTRKYLNFAESLVVVADMALGDELGPKLAGALYLTGAAYDPGTHSSRLCRSRRDYRNYLQIAMLSTYLNLELYSPPRIAKAMKNLFPENPSLTRHATQRALRLDRKFITRTNPSWQKNHIRKVGKKLSQKKGEPLDLSTDPLDSRLQYIWTETWFDTLGI